jgi:hypothetical protein
VDVCRSATATAAALWCWLAAGDVAAAVEFERTADGRLLFTVLGERMALRVSDFRDRLEFKDDLALTHWHCAEEVKDVDQSERTRLQIATVANGGDLLADKPVSKCVWDKFVKIKPSPADSKAHIYTFVVATHVEEGRLFPGGVTSKQMPDDVFAPHRIPSSIFFDLMAQAAHPDPVIGFSLRSSRPSAVEAINSTDGFSPGRWPPHPCETRQTSMTTTGGFEDLGPATLEPWILKKQMTWSGSKRFYLPAERRQGHATEPLCVVCGPYYQGQASTCALYLWSRDKAVRFGMMWSPGSDVRPSERWIDADFALRKIAHSIFIDAAADDFQ